jgi:uncharacterized protein (TIGR00369 family)
VSDGTIHPAFHYYDDPDRPGWKRWELADPTRYNAFLGPIAVKVEDGIARVVMTPERRHSNLADRMHGGAMMGFIDCAMFAACRSFGVLKAGAALTLDLATQFIGAPLIGEDVEARIELLRETGRFLFVRGIAVQRDEVVANFSGTLRKGTERA